MTTASVGLSGIVGKTASVVNPFFKSVSKSRFFQGMEKFLHILKQRGSKLHGAIGPRMNESEFLRMKSLPRKIR